MPQPTARSLALNTCRAVRVLFRQTLKNDGAFTLGDLVNANVSAVAALDLAEKERETKLPPEKRGFPQR